MVCRPPISCRSGLMSQTIPHAGKIKPIFSVNEYFPKFLTRQMHECESRVCVLREARGIFDSLARPGGHHWGLGAPLTPIASLSPTTAIRTAGNTCCG